jgi:hypothetical protein
VSSPWADPSTPTEPGEPYAGPPSGTPYGPAGYRGYPGYPGYPGYGPPGQPGYGYPPVPYGYGYPYAPGPYGYPGPWWPAAPPKPSRPGQVITSAVLAFVQSGLVLFSSLYAWFIASVLGLAARDQSLPSSLRGFGGEITVVAILQLVSVALLILAGIRALTKRTPGAWWLLLAAHGVQLAFCLYWAVRVIDLFNAVPGPDPGGTFATFTLVFAAAPLVGIGLVVGGPGKRWFDGTTQR